MSDRENDIIKDAVAEPTEKRVCAKKQTGKRKSGARKKSVQPSENTTEKKAEMMPEPEAAAMPAAEVTAEADAEPEAVAVPEAEATAEADAEPEAVTVPAAEVTAEADAEPEAVAVPEAEVTAEANAEHEAVTVPIEEPKPQTEADPSLPVEAEAEVEPEVEVEPEAEASVDTDGEPTEADEPIEEDEPTEANEPIEADEPLEDEPEPVEYMPEPETERHAPVSYHHEERHAEKENKSRRVDGLFDFIELFVFTLAAVLLITTFLFRHSVVEGDSMLGTLHDGEALIISDLFYEPERGDIVVVEDFSTVLKKPIIKRVIAIGGDTVRITKTAVYVNGEELIEPYVFTDGLTYYYDVYPSLPLLNNDTLVVEPGEYYELTVPEGELFVMGDHRNLSTDSRDIGTVDEDAVLGRALLRFYPFDKFGKVD